MLHSNFVVFWRMTRGGGLAKHGIMEGARKVKYSDPVDANIAARRVRITFSIQDIDMKEMFVGEDTMATSYDLVLVETK